MELVKTAGAQELQHDMIDELKMLRSLVRETAEGFILRKEGEIESLLAYLNTLTPAKLKAVSTPWLRDLRELKLKPAKGRGKDLKRIDSLLEELFNQIIAVDAADVEKKSAGKAKHGGKHKPRESAR
jgi:hypothetical protein